VPLRAPEVFAALRDAIDRSQRDDAFRILEFSAQTRHLHLMVEALSTRALSNGMRALNIRLTRAYNRVTERKGPLFAERYHAHELRTPTEVRAAYRYILQNSSKHSPGAPEMDSCSSAPWFSGWSETAKACWDGWARAQPGVTEPWTCTQPPMPSSSPAERETECDSPTDKVRCPVVAAKTWLAQIGWRMKTKGGLIKLGERPAEGHGALARAGPRGHAR
jgi:REP element-mobilizing transposase RayT